MAIFRVQSGKNYTGQKNFTQTPSVVSVTNIRYVVVVDMVVVDMVVVDMVVLDMVVVDPIFPIHSFFNIYDPQYIMFIQSQFPPGLPTEELSLWVPALCRHIALVRFHFHFQCSFTFNFTLIFTFTLTFPLLLLSFLLSL